MSAFNNNGVTMKGAIIIASLVAGDTLTFTRIAVGDGVLPSGQTVLTTERLVNPLFNVPISSVTSDNAARATVKGAFNNANLATGFYYREIGLFAINPETNAEELFCYGNAGDLAEWINPVGESSLIEKEIHLVTLIGNATNVAAVFDEDAKVLKSDFDAAMALKADLDATPENGGRVLATQMRFDASQTLYVDAAAAAGGNGSEARPFKTIAAAINARYMGANVIFIKIKPGTYAEELSVPRSPGTTWRITREGTGTVAIKTAVIDNCAYVYLSGLTFNGPIPANSTFIYVANVPSFNLEQVTINGNSDATGVNFSTSRGVMSNCTVNNCGLAIAATSGAMVDLRSVGGTGNTRALQSDGGVIITSDNIPAATVPYERFNGGTISPASWNVIADGATDVTTLEDGIYTIKNARQAQGLPGDNGGTLIIDRKAGTPHIVYYLDDQNYIYHRYFNLAAGTWNNWESYIPEISTATPANYGLMRVAAPVADELDSTCQDAALTPANVHAMANYRIANTYYNVGDTVAVPYHVEFLLKCTQAGRTSEDVLATIDVTKGQVITDGGAKWEVIAKAIIDASISGKVITLTFADETTKTLTTQDTLPTKPTETLLWKASSNAAQTGTTITLNQPISNFDELVFFSYFTSSPYNIVESKVTTKSIINFLNGKEAGNGGAALVSATRFMLSISFDTVVALTKDGSSTTAFKLYASERRLSSIVGVKY